MSEQSAGWYPDPSGANQQRFWDGDSWTEYYQPLAPTDTQIHGSATATQDYPYLAGAQQSAATSASGSANVPASQGWPQGTTDWSREGDGNWNLPAQLTSWGTPAPEQDYASGQTAPPADTGGSTQVYRTGKRSGRGGLIVISLICVVFVALLVVGGWWAFREPEPTRTAIELGTESSESLDRGTEWIGSLSIDDAGAYLIDIRSEDTRDLLVTVQAANGNTIAYNDDRGDQMALGAMSNDPLLFVALEPGEYEVIVAENRDRGDSFTIEATALEETIDLGSSATVDLAGNDAGILVAEVADATEATIAVNASDSNDPVLHVVDLATGSVLDSNDDADSSTRDSLLEDLYLTPGSYAIVVTEYASRELSATVTTTVN